MKHKFHFLLCLLLVMTLLTGCGIKGKAEAQADLLEHKIESGLTQSVTPSPVLQISKAQAEEIALQYAGFTADQVQYLHTEYEIDDRIPQYDVQFYVGATEYEFEIHGENGSILSFDRD